MPPPVYADDSAHPPAQVSCSDCGRPTNYGLTHAVHPVVHRMEAHDVFIGRPSKWGNPFVIGRDGTRQEVIAKYRAWIVDQPELMAALGELRGKVLGCFCAPRPCHGDVLAELANA